MRNDYRRALRTFGSVLLQSDLSSSDLRDFAANFEDPDFVKRVRAFLYEISSAADISETSKSNFRAELASDDEEGLIGYVQRKRIPRSRIISAIRQISGQKFSSEYYNTRTIREIVDDFNQSNPDLVGEFKRFFDAGKGDAFLQGIMNRNKR